MAMRSSWLARTQDAAFAGGKGKSEDAARRGERVARPRANVAWLGTTLAACTIGYRVRRG
jgi:hypothetical protein